MEFDIQIIFITASVGAHVFDRGKSVQRGPRLTLMYLILGNQLKFNKMALFVKIFFSGL